MGRHVDDMTLPVQLHVKLLELLIMFASEKEVMDDSVRRECLYVRSECLYVRKECVCTICSAHTHTHVHTKGMSISSMRVVLYTVHGEVIKTYMC